MTDPTPRFPVLNGKRTMAVEFRFVVPGEPVPKQRARAGKGGRFYTPKETENYERAVRMVATSARPTGWPMRCRYHVEMVVFRSARGDLDNYAKTIDALNPRKAKGGKRPRPAVPGVLWIDDSRVYSDEHRIEDVEPAQARMEVRVVAIPVRCKLKTCGGAETYFPDDEDRCETCAAKRRRTT